MSAKEEIELLYAAARANGRGLTKEERLRLSALFPIERREEDEAKHHTALDACPFHVGDRVLRKTGGSAMRGADARVGTVRRIYTVAKTTRIAHIRVVKLSVDWPAPNRIGGDGWHRSDVLTTAVIPATDAEIERRRALNKARRERLEAARRDV